MNELKNDRLFRISLSVQISGDNGAAGSLHLSSYANDIALPPDQMALLIARSSEALEQIIAEFR